MIAELALRGPHRYCNVQNVVFYNAMNVEERNTLYLQGVLDAEGLFPHLEDEPKTGFFRWDFGLPELPRESGVIVVRGPRQFGKSTWLEHQLREHSGETRLEDRSRIASRMRSAFATP